MAMGSSVMSIPRRRILPEVGAMRPVRSLSVVDFPAPLRPRSPRNDPWGSASDTPSTARLGPKALVTFSNSTASIGGGKEGLHHFQTRATIGSFVSLSQPQRRGPLPPPPSTRGVKALVCPQCKTRYDETPGGSGTQTCPRDQARLVRVSDMAEAQGDPMLGRTLDGRFTILARLGAGSMGTVYRARQHAMGRDVSIKILRSDRALDDSAKGRFLREARANSLLASPHTVTVFDFGQTASGELFLAMELLHGESLGQRMARLGRLPADAAVDTVRQSLRSLAE